jgi:predicted metal-dependent hydrolase
MRVSGLDIQIKKSDRKTVSIFVERDGSVSARVPQSLTDVEIAEVLKRKEYQIFKNISEWTLLNDAKKNREFVNGQSFLYLGRNYRLKMVSDDRKDVRFYKGYFELPKGEVKNAALRFKEFYKSQLLEKLKAPLQTYSLRLGLEPNEVKVMELQNRWASCSEKGTVSFHWKCAMAPIDVIGYIVAHELTHLEHPNHTPRFWNKLDKIYPNYQKQQEWLRSYGAGMDL